MEKMASKSFLYHKNNLQKQLMINKKQVNHCHFLTATMSKSFDIGAVHPRRVFLGAMALGAVCASAERITGNVAAELLPYAWQTRLAVAALPLVGGFLLTRIAKQTFREHMVNVEPGNVPDSLCTVGPFAFSRNPIYLGAVLILIGETLATNSVFPAIFGFCSALSAQFITIPREEEALKKAFPGQFEAYAAKVGRWF